VTVFKQKVGFIGENPLFSLLTWGFIGRKVGRGRDMRGDRRFQIRCGRVG